jgi:hypothetical protein
MGEFRSRWRHWSPGEGDQEEGVQAFDGIGGGLPRRFQNTPPPHGKKSFPERLGRAPSEPSKAPSEVTPAEELNRDWGAAEARARAEFQARGVEPSEGTLRAAVVLALYLAKGWKLPGKIPEAEARKRLEGLLSGEFAGRVDEHGRVLLTAALGPGTTAEQAAVFD